MLKKIDIENFRLFKRFELDGLKRVNLFAGKNNSGKTALLEALRIAAASENISVMEYILIQRGEGQRNTGLNYDSFFNRAFLKATKPINETSISFKINDFEFVKLFRSNYAEFAIQTLGGPRTLQNFNQNNGSRPYIPRDQAIVVPFGGKEFFPLQDLWDKVALTPKEDFIIKILQETVLPGLIRFDVQQDERVVVRMDGEEKPIPLKNMGDGADRAFRLALALVSAADNQLLIDEIETGLHHSVLEKLWEIVFKYAKQLNVQVFATTHSQDALETFLYVLERAENREQGAFFRLQRDPQSGDTKAVSYDLKRLEDAIQNNAEIR